MTSLDRSKIQICRGIVAWSYGCITAWPNYAITQSRNHAITQSPRSRACSRCRRRETSVDRGDAVASKLGSYGVRPTHYVRQPMPYAVRVIFPPPASTPIRPANPDPCPQERSKVRSRLRRKTCQTRNNLKQSAASILPKRCSYRPTGREHSLASKVLAAGQDSHRLF
jgi:hypothetical protein